MPVTGWRKEHDRLEQEYATGQAELSPIYAEVKKLWQIKYKVEQVVRAQENPEQSRRNSTRSTIKEDFKNGTQLERGS